MKVGAHVSISGGIDKSPKRAADLDCDCYQIFAKNPRGWKVRDLKKNEGEKTKENLEKYDLDPLVVHISYLVNVGTPKDDLYEKSLRSLKAEYKRTGQIGGKYLVLHPGKYTKSNMEDGIQRIGEAINEVFSEIDSDVMILLENVAGAGTSIGKSFEELKQIMDLIDDKDRVGICFDTCHGFSAGYDLRTEESVDQVFRGFDKIIGFDKMKVIHANDSKKEYGTNKDRHEHIGQGYIGEEGFRAMIHHPLIKEYDVPFLLETPVDEEGNFETNIAKLRELARE